jgi:hypothetical protein
MSAAGKSQTKEGTVTCRVGAISVIDDANVTTLRCISTGTLEGVADTTYEIAATAQGYYVLGVVENGRPIGGMPQTAAELAELTTKHSMRLAATPVVRGIHDASGNL